MASPSAEFIHAALRSLSNRIESVNQTWQGDDVEIRHQQEALRSELGRLQVPSLPSSVPWSPLQSARHVLSGVLGFNRRRKTQRRCTQPSWSRISRLRLSGTPSAPTPISSAQTFGKLAKISRQSWPRCATRFSHAQLTLSVSSCLAGCITLSVRVFVLCLFVADLFALCAGVHRVWAVCSSRRCAYSLTLRPGSAGSAGCRHGL